MPKSWSSHRRHGRWTAVASLFLTLSSCAGHSGHSCYSAQQIAALVKRYTAIPPSKETGNYKVYRVGQGPSVLILHELPGLTPQCLHLGELVAAAGYTVSVPLLFGQAGEDSPKRNIFRACFGGGFHCFSRHDPGPVLTRLRVLARTLRGSRCDPIGVISMCLTGNLAIALLADPGVAAPVVSQPALPLAWTDRGKSSLGISPHDVKAAKERGVHIHAFRFNNDSLSPRQRSRTLRREFGNQITVHEIDSSSANLHGFSQDAHAVLTEWFVDQSGDPTRDALDTVLEFFKEQLPTPAAPPPASPATDPCADRRAS